MLSDGRITKQSTHVTLVFHELFLTQNYLTFSLETSLLEMAQVKHRISLHSCGIILDFNLDLDAFVTYDLRVRPTPTSLLP
jgi:hypothetical protein